MPKLLVVDDTQVDAELLQRRLNRRGFVATAAFSGKEGVARAKAEIPDAVLMDWSMPEYSGGDAIKELRNDPATSGIPVIVLSAYAGQGTHRQDALDVGAVAFVSRPPNLDELVTMIHAEIGRAGRG